MGIILLTTVNAVLPIVLLILLGYVLRRVNFLTDGFVKTGNKLVFNVCLPCMLFVNIYQNMDSFADIRWDVVLYSLAVICAAFVLGLAVCMLATKESMRRGVMLQCIFRSNYAIIGLTLVERLGGDSGIAGIVSAFSIPLFNMLGVVALTIFVGGGQSDSPLGKRIASRALRILKGVVTNPLIIAVFLGLVAVGIREIERAVCGYVPFTLSGNLKFLFTCLNDLKAIASPFALVIMGGQFRFSAVKGMTKEIVVGVVGRLVAVPLLGIGLAIALGNCGILHFGTEVYPTLVSLFCTPVAVSSAIMAQAMHNDGQLGTQYVVWSSVFSVPTIFLAVALLMVGGYIAVV